MVTAGSLSLVTTAAYADGSLSLRIVDSPGHTPPALSSALAEALSNTATYLSDLTGRSFHLVPSGTDSLTDTEIGVMLAGEIAADSGCVGFPQVALFPNHFPATIGGPPHFVDSLRPTILSRRRLAYDLIDPLMRSVIARPVKNRSRGQTMRQYPLSLLVDSTFIRDASPEWDVRIRRILDVMNKQLARQLQISLELKSLSIVSFAGSTDPALSASYDALARQATHGGDTLVMLLRTDTSRVQSAFPHSVHLGMSEHGSRRLVVHTPRFGENEDTLAWYLETTVTIMHELGHAWGAVHVSDPRSVMNHSLTPYGSLDLDTANESIIRAFLNGSSRVNRSLDLRMIDSLLISTGYALLDLPELFGRVIHEDTAADSLERELSVSGLSGEFQSALRVYRAILDQDGTGATDSLGSIRTFLNELPSAYASLFLFAAIQCAEDGNASYWLGRAVEANYDLAREYILARCDSLRRQAIPPVDNE